MRMSDWSSGVCSSDLLAEGDVRALRDLRQVERGTDSFAAAEQVPMFPKDRPAETVGRGIACADADGAMLAFRQSRRQRKAAAGRNVFADVDEGRLEKAGTEQAAAIFVDLDRKSVV